MKLSKAQIDALKMVERRDWPAGEPRVSWFRRSTLAVLLRHKLVEERFPGILHLSDAGHQALASKGGGT